MIKAPEKAYEQLQKADIKSELSSTLDFPELHLEFGNHLVKSMPLPKRSLTKINKQQFKLKANSFYKVYSRLIIDDNKVDINRYYDFYVKENNQKLGNYLFEGPNSTSSAYIKTNYLDIYNKALGKENYFSLTVPEPKDENKNYSYYTFDVGANDTNKVLIKIIEYGTSEK